MSKGSAPRPYSVSADEFGDNWARVFGNKERDATDGDLPGDSEQISKEIKGNQSG